LNCNEGVKKTRKENRKLGESFFFSYNVSLFPERGRKEKRIGKRKKKRKGKKEK